MNTQADVPLTGRARNSINKELGAMTDLVGSLSKLSRRIGMQALAALFQTGVPHGVILEIRRRQTDFSDAVTQIRVLRHQCQQVTDQSMRHRLNQLLSQQQLAVLETFSDSVREVCAQLTSPRVNLQKTVSEMVRLIDDELDLLLQDLSTTLKEALQIAHTLDRDLAFMDELTSLPNRRALYQFEGQVAARIAANQQVTLLQLDLDRFKQVNDSLGHAAGDVTLCRVAGILRAALRDSDFVARIGGDEFVLLFFGTMTATQIVTRAADIIACIEVPFTYRDKSIHVSATVGISTSNMDNCQTLDRMLNNADLALYSAKADEKGKARLFTPQMRTLQEETDSTIEQILTGIQDGQFVPYYQPQVEGRSGRLVGLETLMRWLHPRRGVLSPIHFMKIAEQGGVLNRIQDAVNRNALMAMRRWQDQELPIPQLSINMTSEYLSSTDLIAQLVNTVAECGLQPPQIGLEILESAMIEVESGSIVRNIRDLSELGFRIELDDFGTGHASIANLRHFKVDRIKIDRSFVKDVHLYNELSKITSSIIGLAHSLRIDALGEGVETPEERLVLNALGCDHIQGFGVGRPMPEADIAGWIRRTQSPRQVPISLQNL